MNKLQQAYIDKYFGGKMPRTKSGKAAVEALAPMMSDRIRVHFPDFHGLRFEPAHTTEFVLGDENNVPNGILSLDGLVANLQLWQSRGYEIEYL